MLRPDSVEIFVEIEETCLGNELDAQSAIWHGQILFERAVISILGDSGHFEQALMTALHQSGRSVFLMKGPFFTYLMSITGDFISV